MSFKCWDITRTSTSPRLIPEWKDLKPLLKGILKDKQAVLWIQKKAAEMEGVIKKIKFHVMAQVPPIQAMVHIAPYHMLIAYCDDMCLRLFGDHHQGFISLGMVPCRFSISCLSYDSETEMLLSGTLGAVVTWFILPNGRGLQMAQTVPMPGGELVQGFSLNGPPGFLVAHCENKLRVFTHQGQGQLEEVKKFTPINSGSTITCSFTCLSQGYFYVGNKDGEIHAWGLDRGNFLHSFQAHSSSVICIQSRSETYTLLTAGGEGVVKEWNLAFGNLLRQLDIDKNMQRLQFIDNSTFFCQTNHNFSLYHLRYFYSLFNVCGSAPQEVRRVCCGHNWTRILCATKDGLLRFLSPVTGDLLVITWPLLIMDKAVAWAYDSHREELFVATDGSEVLVFDATRSPCTAKYLMCPSVNPGDRVRCLAYGHYHLGKGLVGLMFSGHDSGTVRILSHYSCARVAKILHSGAVLALSTLEGPQEYSLVCSYGMDNIVYLTEAVLQGNRVVLQPVSKIICVWPLKHVILLPGSVGAITENHHWHLWSYQNLLTSPGSKQRSDFKETECLHRCAITSFDVCLSLKLFVTGDTGGLVRIWDFHGKLISELDSALHFGPLCFANDRGDLLLTFNQSLYLVSCLKLLPPAQLIHLTLLNNADDIQEAPKPFLPSFFFSFEKVFVPKFVYFGQGLQELRGLEALVNKRMIAFDHTVPHVVEEERPKSSVMQEGPTLHFLEDKYTDFPILTPKRDRPPFVVPPQLRLGGWDGLKPYQILRCFFGQGRPWPFPPDGYIPNSVIRARLWPEGTPVFLHCDLHSSYQDKDWDMTGLSRSQALSPVTSIKQKISKRKPDRKPTLGKQTFFDILVNLASQNWMGRKLDEGLINTIIETILNLTVYCSIEQYKTYISILAQIFASHQVSPRWHSETACRLMEDTTHSNPEVRETAWEGLEKLGFMSRLFAIPLAVGLMDSDKNVRAKALYLMVRVTGIQTKSMLIALLKRRDTLQEMQEDFIGEISLDQLLGIQPSGIQYLLTQVEQRLNENLTLSHREEKPPLLLVISRDRELDEQTLKIWSEPAKIAKPDQRMTRVTAKSKNLIKKDMKISRKQGETELSPVLVTLEHEGEQREAKESDQIDIQDVASEPELSLSTLSPVTSKEDAESKEVVLETKKVTELTKALEIKKAVKAREAVEAMGVMKAIDQQYMRDYGKVIPEAQRQEHLKKLWERAMKKTHHKVSVKLKEKRKLKEIPETTAEEPKKEVIQVAEQEDDATKVFRKDGRGLSGIPGRTTKSETRSWRDDICNLVTSRIASSNPRMLRDLSEELVNWAQAILAPQEPSWDLFQEICPLLKDSSELDDMEMEETPVVTEGVTEVVKEEKTVGLGEQEQRAKKMLKKGKVSSKVKKKKVAYLDDHQVSDKMRFQKVKILAMQKGKIIGEERKLSKQDLKLMQGKEKLTKDKKSILQKEKRAEEEEISPISQKKLTKAEQKEKIEKVSPKEEKWVMEKEDKISKEKKQWAQERKLALPEEKQAQKERIWGQKESERIKQWAWRKEKLSQEEKKQAGEMDKKSQQRQARALEKRLTQEDSIMGKEERHIAKKERAIAREGIGVTKRKEKATQEEKETIEEEGKLAYDVRAKEMGVAKEEKKRIQEESIQGMRKLDMGMGISSEGRETSSREKDIRKKESHLMRILVKIIREMNKVPLKETGIPEEDQLFSMGMSETDGQRWEFSKEPEEITREEKQLVQRERKLEDDRLATEERILTDEEGLEEDQRLLEKVQENILLDKTQVDSMLKEAQQQNLLGEKQLKKLLKIIKEKKPEKTQKKEKKVSLSEEELEESLAGKHKKKSSTQIRKKEKKLTQEKEKLHKKVKEGPHEEEMELFSKEEGRDPHMEEEEEDLSEEEESQSEENLSEEEEGLSEEESLSEEEEEGLSEEEEGLSEEEEGLSEEEKSLSEKEKSLSKKEKALREKKSLTLGKEKGMVLKVLGHHFDLEGQESQLLKAYPVTTSWGRQEDVLLEKGRGMFLQVMGMETQTPKGLHKPKSHLLEIIRESQKPKRRPKDGTLKWFLQSQDSQKGKTEGQAPAPAPTTALYPSLTSMPAKRLDSPDEDWISNVLVRLEAGEQLSRDSFHRLSQLLKHLTSKGYLKQTHLYSLKAVAKRLQQNLQGGHRDISRCYKDALSPVYIKAIPPIRRKEMESWGEPLPIPTSALPSMTYRVQDPKALTWLLLGEPYRSARAQQLSHVLQEMGMQHFHPATRDIFTGAHASVGKQTLALMFQNDLRALKGEGRALKLPQLEKKAQPVSKDKEELPQWETFVALYHVLRMLQKRYARDSAAWMEQFKRLMDLYQLKSPRIQRLLLELLWGKRLQPQQIIYEDIARIKELVPGERLLSDLLCGSSRTPAGPLEFQNVVPLPGQNRVHTIQPTGIAQYGFLELAWKRLPRVNPYRRERLPNIPTPTL
ncbi:WD repeat-containing protein 87-like [Ovis aries]|uniref:WD repeat-containing protein 87-like n=1 Tax=Ovis aries TaxID=9940 RepID=UPI002952615E|nr:WD repeat-containing protein 87-like [Ovis aries]